MPESELTRRRKEQRRQAAARSCLPRLAADGYADARIEALAADAGLTRQALLFYFGGKGDLWAEAVACAHEEALAALTRLVAGEAGPAAVRALRRGLDEVGRVLPAAFAVLLDAAGSAPRPSPAQRDRIRAAEAALESTLARALAGPRGDDEDAKAFARIASVTQLAPHPEARAQGLAARQERAHLAAELDYAEAQLVALASRPRR